ncbi:hypothetical protein NDU88_002009 [Pleurodeles waltl]|uniref:Uncharacterized protein n=1 Tax=Pleurodeles waltl TaxID=8319 RepID=A0AAV7U850_PLEWA|nr:hypothetical protein NDU88_002009 [Pleurodeles waltl]
MNILENIWAYTKLALARPKKHAADVRDTLTAALLKMEMRKSAITLARNCEGAEADAGGVNHLHRVGKNLELHVTPQYSPGSPRKFLTGHHFEGPYVLSVVELSIAHV